MMNRRRLLQGLGATAAALPFLRTSLASAQVATPKLLIYASPTGFLVGPSGNAELGYDGWLPSSLRSGDTHAEMDVPDTLPDILRPLDRHKSEILFLDGIRGVDRVGGHQQSVSILTGTGVYGNEAARAAGGDGEFYGDGVSIDQLIAERIGSRVLGLSAPIEGYQLGEGYMSHLGPNRGFTPIQSPNEAFERVFGEIGSSAGDQLARFNRRRSVLDVIARDVGSVQRRLPSVDRARLDDHLSSIRAIEADLTAPPACGALDAPGSYDVRRGENFVRLMRDYSRIMVQALACGYTRVGFLQWGNLEGNFTPNWPEFDAVSGYRDHAIAHKFMNDEGAGSDGLTQATAIPLGLNLQRAYNTVFAELLDGLRSTLDVDGRPLLDNTLVVHVKPMGVNHDIRRLFWYVAGGRALGVRPGRFVRLERREPYRYYNDLHVAIAQAMGLSDVTSFGEPGLNRAPIDLG
jgi:hypothetical protein